MSAYSALVLAANVGVRGPTSEQTQALFEEVGLLRPHSSDYVIDNLAADITALFDDPAARDQNALFFAPDSIGLLEGVEVAGPDCDYTGGGWSVQIHGNGYLFPWAFGDLRTRVLGSPKLVRLRAVIQERFGGRFRFPTGSAELRERLIDGGEGWVWFMSESV